MARILFAAAALVLGFAVDSPAFAQVPACPHANLMYCQAFLPGGESDPSARYQQVVPKKKCPAVDTLIQYRTSAGAALLWSEANTLRGDGLNVVGINLPHMVLQPMEGQRLVQDRRRDAGVLVSIHARPAGRPRERPIKSFADFVKAAKAEPGKINLGSSGQNSAKHAAHERLDRDFGVKTTYVPYKGTGDLALAVLGGHIDGATTYTPFATANKGKVRSLAVAMEQRHQLLPDVPTSKELGVDWVDGGFRGIDVPKSTPPEARRGPSEMLATLNADPEMKELAAKSGFEPVNVGVDGMDVFVRTRTRVYTEVGKRMGLGTK